MPRWPRAARRRRRACPRAPRAARRPAATRHWRTRRPRAVVVDGHDDDRARVVHDVTVELARRRAPATRTSRDRQEPGVARASSEPTTRKSRRRRGRRVTRRGRRRGVVDRRAGAAARDPRPGRAPPRTNAANSGCGRSGRLLNSGCAWVATKNGCDRAARRTRRGGRRARCPSTPAVLLEPGAVLVVDLVAVAVALVDDFFAVGLVHDRCRAASFAGYAPRRIVPPMSTTSRCSSMRSITGCGRVRVELARVGAGEAALVAGELDHRALQAEAQAEERDAVLAGEAGRGDLALDAAEAEAAGDRRCRRGRARRPSARRPSASSDAIQSISTCAPHA